MIISDTYLLLLLYLGGLAALAVPYLNWHSSKAIRFRGPTGPARRVEIEFRPVTRDGSDDAPAADDETAAADL